MPIYEYHCQSCDHEFEALQKMSDPLLTDCPACQQQALRKKVSAAAFRLKGGGWYETDFKNGKKRNVAGSESSGAGAGDKDKASSAEGKTSESKTSESKSNTTKKAASPAGASANSA